MEKIEGMRPAGPIPSFSLIGNGPQLSSALCRVESRSSRPLSCSAFGSLRGRRSARRCSPITGPRTAVLACLFQDAWPRPPPRRSVSVSTVECTSTRVTRGLCIRSFRLPSLSGAPACGFPCPLGHPLARDPSPQPIGARCSPEVALLRHRGCIDYASRAGCLGNKLCTTCVNRLEIDWKLREALDSAI